MKRILVVAAMAAGYWTNNGIPFLSGGDHVKKVRVTGNPAKLPALYEILATAPADCMQLRSVKISAGENEELSPSVPLLPGHILTILF
jgi:hypothetical protein